MSLQTHNPARTSQLARQIASEWSQQGNPDTLAALSQYPDLSEDRSAILDLAYEEYCLRRQAGEDIDINAYCARFPQIQSYLHRVLASDQALVEHPSIVEAPIASTGHWPLPGEMFGSCLLVRELGRGTFARVYLAIEQSAGDRPVALKLSRVGNHEARTLGRIHNDHIVPILWASRQPGTDLNVVCMPFLGSATLADIIDRLYPAKESRPPHHATALLDALRASSHRDDPTPDIQFEGLSLHGLSFTDGVARLASTIASALQFLHERRLYHCDIKPSNLLLTPQASPLLLDFNLSHTADKPSCLIGGTFVYMPPEQLRYHLDRPIDPVEQTAQADLFSFGVVLYELLTGKLPFGQPPSSMSPQDLPAWLLERMQGGMIPLARWNPDVPENLTTLVERCLALDPADRPASAQEIVQSLTPRRSRSRRRRLLLALLALPFLTLLAFSSAHSSNPRTEAQASVVLEPDPHQELLAHRQAALRALQHGAHLQAINQSAEEPLRKASEHFVRAVSLHPRARTTSGAWQDHLGQARIEIMRQQPVKAEPHLHDAKQQLVKDLTPLVVQTILGPTSSPGVLAAASFPQLREKADSLGAILAVRSYAETLRKNHTLAVTLGEQALALNFQSPTVLTNLAYSSMQRGKSGVPRARKYLREALRRQPNYAPALFVACRLTHRQCLQERQPIPAYLLDDFERALELRLKEGGSEPAEAYHLATLIYSRACLDLKLQVGELRNAEENAEQGQLQQEWRRREQKTRDYLLRACTLGLPGSLFQRDPILTESLGDWLRPERLTVQGQPVALPGLSLYVRDPLMDQTP